MQAYITGNYDNLNYETLSIDAEAQYYWRVTAQDYWDVHMYATAWTQVNLNTERPLNTKSDNSADQYYIDFTKPNFDYSFILNNIYNNYFDLYIKANEDIETNDSLFYSYHQLEQISPFVKKHLYHHENMNS